MFLFVLGLLVIIGGIIFGGMCKGVKAWRVNYKQFVIAFAGLVLIALSCINEVPTGHTGIVTMFGKVENETLEAGIHMLAPWKKVIKMDNRTQKGSMEMDCFSSDIQEVVVKYTINYQINKKNAQEIYKTIGISYYDVVIVPRVQESVKAITAKYTAENLVSTRTEFGEKIEEDLKNQLTKYNIELVGTAIENMTFTEAFTTAVEEKQVAQQNKLKAETQKQQAIIESQAKAETQLIESKAEAQANDLLEKSLTDKILRQQFLDKWNGELPKVMGSDGNMIDISALMGNSTNSSAKN